MQSVPTTTDVRGEVCAIQHLEIQFVSDLQQVSVSSTNTRHDIAELPLKLALNTNQSINQLINQLIN
jgi:hypothetical protein